MGDPPTDPARAGNATPLVQLTLARLREFYREPAAVFWVYGFPRSLAVSLGIAFKNRPVERIRVDLAGEQTPTIREKVHELLKADARLEIRLVSDEEGRERLRTAKTDLVVYPLGNGP